MVSADVLTLGSEARRDSSTAKIRPHLDQNASQLLRRAKGTLWRSDYCVARKAVTSLICSGLRFFEFACMIALARALDANASN
jgi:hypothetical protein